MFDPKESGIQAQQSNSVKESDFPIHSMKQDLERVRKNPQYNPGSFSEEQIEKKESSIQSSLSEKQKTSPFLAENPQNKTYSEVKKEKPVEIPQENIPIQKAPSQPESPVKNLPKTMQAVPETGGPKTSWMILPAILIVIGAGFGIYYYLNQPDQEEITEQVSNEVAPISAESDLSPNNEAQPEQNPPVNAPDPEKIELFEDKPNFMVISEGKELDSLVSYASQVKEKASDTLIEFVPTDEKYVPLKFSEFSQKFSLSYPVPVSEMIDDESLFSLYAFNESGKVKIGLLINLKNPQNSEQILSAWESAMPMDLETLYLEGFPQESNNTWNSGDRDGVKTRYKNLLPNGALSLDYAVIKNKLMIATSKNFSWNLIDRLNQ